MDGKNSFIGKLLGGAEKFSNEQVAQTIQLLLEHGVRWQASDIHIEPHENYVLVRYRIDGSLRGAHKISRMALLAILAQLKNLAHLDVTEQYTPQQGSFSTTIGEVTYEIRLATMPVLGGEKATLHIVPQVKTPLSLDALGFWGTSLHALQASLARNHGMIIVSAPKHNGRPTTQASMLTALNNPSLNIATVEEAVEYRIPHASQTAVNPRAGLTLHSGLQAVLQQDPNVIMISNLPDKSTAELAIETAMAGHLVVAGMHSDAASTALLHLRAMGVPSYLIATATRTVVAQRLIRKLCEHCRERYELTLEQLQLLERMFGINSKAAFLRINQLEEQATALGLGNDPRLSSSSDRITHLWRPHREGCETCEHTGYVGRVGLVEVMPVNDAVQKLLVAPETTAATIQARAIQDGFIPLALDGLIKALRGMVTIKEVLHVVDRALRA